MLYFSDELDIDDTFELKSENDIMEFLNQYARKFIRISDIKKVAQGGESSVFYIEPFLPIEAVAKVSNDPN